MSDRVPHSTFRLNDIGDKCIRLILDLLPLYDLLTAGNVCTLWSTVQKDLCHTRKSLILIHSSAPYQPLNVPVNHWNQLEVLAGKPDQVVAFHRAYQLNGFQTANFYSFDACYSWVDIFPNISELTIGWLNDSFEPLNRSKDDLEGILQLFAHLRSQLVSLKLWFRHINLADTALFTALNSMSTLKHLDITLQNISTAPFDLPLLRYLDTFNFYFDCSRIMNSVPILHQWTPHIIARSSPLQFSFICFEFWNDQLLTLDPAFASMFTSLNSLNINNLPDLAVFSSRFINLSKLNLYLNAIPVVSIFEALANLKQLINLKMVYIAAKEQLPAKLILPQLPSVTFFKLVFFERATHAHLANLHLSWTFPMLQVLNIWFAHDQCADCSYKRFNRHQAWWCFKGQLRLLKQGFKHLKIAELANGQISCRFEETQELPSLQPSVKPGEIAKIQEPPSLGPQLKPRFAISPAPSSKIMTPNASKRAAKPESAMLPIIENFIAWVNYELKYMMSGLEPKNLAIFYTLPNNINRWTANDVYTFLHTLGFKHSAEVLYQNDVDGLAFTLLRRDDLVHGLGISIGTAVKLYAYVKRIRGNFTIDL